MHKTLLRLHTWIGLVAGPLIVLAATTAIALNHQDLWREAPAATDGPIHPYSQYLLAFAADPERPERHFVGTSEGLFRSDDGGQHWQAETLPVPARQVSELVFDPHQSGVLYAGLRYQGVYRRDGAGQWTSLPLPAEAPAKVEIVGLALPSPDEMVLATTAGIFRQQQDGWSLIPRPAQAEPTARRRWLQLAYDLHDGRFWGTWGRPITDAVSCAMIGIVVSGYWLYVGKRRQRRPVASKGQVVSKGG